MAKAAVKVLVMLPTAYAVSGVAGRLVVVSSTPPAPAHITPPGPMTAAETEGSSGRSAIRRSRIACRFELTAAGTVLPSGTDGESVGGQAGTAEAVTAAGLADGVVPGDVAAPEEQATKRTVPSSASQPRMPAPFRTPAVFGFPGGRL